MDKGQIFTVYNFIKARAPLSYKSRINRALGVAQLKTSRPYKTTLTSCTCPDFYYRKVICKHIIAEHIKLGLNVAETLLDMLK